MVAPHMDRAFGLKRSQRVNHFIGPRTISDHIAQIPEFIETPTDVAPRYSQYRFKSLQISVDIRDDERAHKRTV